MRQNKIRLQKTSFQNKNIFLNNSEEQVPISAFFRGFVCRTSAIHPLLRFVVHRGWRQKRYSFIAVTTFDIYRSGHKESLSLKGTVQRDFLLQFFSLNGLSWSQQTCLKAISNFVKFSWSYLYLKYQNIDSPLLLTAGSQKFSLRQPIFFTLLKCSW